MITWGLFLPFAIVAALFWLMGTVAALRQKEGVSRFCVFSMAAGTVVYSAFIAGLWYGLGRPPLRTLGETRLWYSLFMIVSCLMVYIRWHYRWIPLSSTIVALVFVTINIVRPDIHDQSLMPALQSAWFIPHVTVYMFSYSIFGCAFLLAIAGLWHLRQPRPHRHRLPDVRHAFGMHLGKTGLGRLLDMGPEGDMGSRHVGGLSRLYPPPSPSTQPSRILVAHHRIPATPDVLVWSQLPALGKLEYA